MNKRFYGTDAIILLLLCAMSVTSSCISLGHTPRKARLEIPETHVAMSKYQDNMTIDSFNVKVIDSQLDIFNSKSLISYSVSGTIKGTGLNNIVPEIVHVLVSQQSIPDDDSPRASAEICKTFEITPIVGTPKRKNLHDIKMKEFHSEFHFTNELTISSPKWGKNRIKFVCGEHEQEIILDQKGK